MDKQAQGGHWLWTGPCSHGYGVIGAPGGRGAGTIPVHRLVYELLVGPIPANHELDHLCELPACCNPAHLEAVTHKVNLERGRVARKATCPHGHTLDGVRRHFVRGAWTSHRYCLTCNRERARPRDARSAGHG